MHSNSNGRMSINLKEDGVETDKVKKINGQIHVADILVQDAEDKLFGKFINGVDEQSPLNWVSKSADEQFDGNFWDEFDDKTSSLDTKSSDEQSDACSSTPEAHYDRANSLPFSSSINILPSPDLSLSTPPQAGGGLRHCVTAPVSRNRSFILEEEEIEFSRSMFEKRNKPRHDLRLDRLSEHDKQKLIVELVRIQNDGTVEVDLTKNAPVASELLELQTVEDSLPNVDRIVTDFNKSVPKLQIAMLVVGTRGDVQPFLAMAKKLQEFGHRVRLATHINFRDFVKSAGVEFYPLGGDPRVLSEYMARNKGLVPSAPGEISVQRKQLKAIIQSLLPACTEPDIETGQPFRVQAIIANPPAYGHAHVAEALEVPIHIFFTMPWTPTSEFPHPLARVPQSAGYWLSYILVDLLIWWGIRSYINDFRKKKLNLPPIAYFSTYHGSISHLPTGYIWSPHVVPKPRDWGPLVDVVGYCFLNLGSNYQPPDAFAQWIQSGPKPIYIGFGSMPLEDSKKTTEIILEALKSTGQRGIIDRGWGGLGNCPGIPETVYLISDCPHDWLFPQCSAVIHHGGAGTTATGLRAGCPTTIVPFFGDQYFWGDRVHQKGLGPPPIPISQLSIENLSDAIKFMLQPEVKSQAMELATLIENEDGVTGAVDAFHRHLPPELPLPTATFEEDDDRPTFLQWLFIRIGKICSLPCESQVLGTRNTP
ncbi:sterol 3-beta-glucosyltransferase UGT80B1-like isoform X2 [Ipomoea triloba]|uniref:sterol 3-beta-glucosyltransferase UGT80B1-like isoform X1 n=2 Tax=Ipomoea triloba TaxID=35885 RepID=UPI00125E81F2|nr:sterol 3-beta-glucosyltransferase UGT80B1-like isoform X1 [Ipomoea triloba]XP_031121740.1 sterol 3-beta-glucosyltransferase UGT80B1-like isoform X1 [Ipomoea triloba]XP_031121749.1 sterol 3-beta-glucosyltransferase UGT80B1-like isoform X2 [Ipomoea triloba]